MEKKNTLKEKEIDMMFNAIATRLDSWLDTYSIEKIDTCFFQLPIIQKEIVKNCIKNFTKKPIQGKNITLTEYTLKKCFKK